MLTAHTLRWHLSYLPFWSGVHNVHFHGGHPAQGCAAGGSGQLLKMLLTAIVQQEVNCPQLVTTGQMPSVWGPAAAVMSTECLPAGQPEYINPLIMVSGRRHLSQTLWITSSEETSQKNWHWPIRMETSQCCWLQEPRHTSQPIKGYIHQHKSLPRSYTSEQCQRLRAEPPPIPDHCMCYRSYCVTWSSLSTLTHSKLTPRGNQQYQPTCATLAFINTSFFTCSLTAHLCDATQWQRIVCLHCHHTGPASHNLVKVT